MPNNDIVAILWNIQICHNKCARLTPHGCRAVQPLGSPRGLSLQQTIRCARERQNKEHTQKRIALCPCYLHQNSLLQCHMLANSMQPSSVLLIKTWGGRFKTPSCSRSQRAMGVGDGRGGWTWAMQRSKIGKKRVKTKYTHICRHQHIHARIHTTQYIFPSSGTYRLTWYLTVLFHLGRWFFSRHSAQNRCQVFTISHLLWPWNENCIQNSAVYASLRVFTHTFSRIRVLSNFFDLALSAVQHKWIPAVDACWSRLCLSNQGGHDHP